jgi:hypothetical protein
MGKWKWSSNALKNGTKRRWVVSFTPRALYLRGSIPGTHPLDRRLGCPQSRSGLYGQEKNLTKVIKVIRRTVLRNNCLRCLLYLYFDRYMFRPLSAILRWNTQYIKKLLLLQRIRCILYKSYCILFWQILPSFT